MTRVRAGTWHERAAALQAVHAARHVMEFTELRLAMGELWQLLNDVPYEILVAYRNLGEEDIQVAARAYRDGLDDGRLLWTISNDYPASALSIGAQLRALDGELSQRPRFKSAPTSGVSLLCKEVDAYIIPRQSPKPVDRRPGPGNGFGRRATPHHRILPRTIDGRLEVELIWSPHLSFGLLAGETQRLGAALFPLMKVEFEQIANGTHKAVAAACSDEEAILAEQLAGAYSGPMLAIAWPELTMPPDRLARVSSDMKARSLMVEALEGPVVTVAGSWHEERDGVIRNVMRVLDKTGAERLAFDKITTFVGGGATEANVPGNLVPVLLNNDALITFAVCSDFCDLELEPPYLTLDVDLLVVPSLGSASALNGHEMNAKRFGILFGTSTFLVQQNEEPPNPVGWVLPHCKIEKKSAVEEAWSVRQIAFI